MFFPQNYVLRKKNWHKWQRFWWSRYQDHSKYYSVRYFTEKTFISNFFHQISQILTMGREKFNKYQSRLILRQPKNRKYPSISRWKGKRNRSRVFYSNVKPGRRSGLCLRGKFPMEKFRMSRWRSIVKLSLISLILWAYCILTNFSQIFTFQKFLIC